jgi:hypothetical protein
MPTFPLGFLFYVWPDSMTKRGSVHAILFFAWALLYPGLTHAEFLVTHPGAIYQEARGEVKVIVSQSDETQGLFVMAGPAIAPAEFHFESPKSGETNSVFIHFNSQVNPPRYDRLTINKQTFLIDGNLSLDLGRGATLTVDNNNPYLTIESISADKTIQSSLIGFSGVNEVVRAADSLATVFSANQSMDDTEQAYSVNEGQLLLNGEVVSAQSVGRFVRLRNECLNTGSIVLHTTDILKLQHTKAENQRVELLQELINKARADSPLKKYITLSAEPAYVILFNVETSGVYRMKPMVPKGIQQKVCVLQEITRKDR